jgi:hypothetical protein
MSVYAVNIAYRNYDIISVDILSGILPQVAYLASSHCSCVKLWMYYHSRRMHSWDQGQFCFFRDNEMSETFWVNVPFLSMFRLQ